MSGIGKTRTSRKKHALRQAELRTMKLRDIITQDVITLTQDQTLREAVEALSEAGVSGAPVVSGSRTVGVIALSDIIDFAASMWPMPAPPMESDDFESRSGAETGGTPTAFYTDLWSSVDRDVLDGIIEAQEWNILEEHTISEVMTRKLMALPTDADVAAAIKVMVDSDIHRLLVMDEAELRGIVTTMDFLRLVAQNND